MATQAEVAKHLDLSQAAVSRLAASGVLAPPNGRGSYSLDDSRVAYIRHLREVAAGRSAGDPDAPNLVLERARLARAQADAQERKNREAADELIEVEEASRVFFDFNRQQRDSWLNWPSRIAPLLAAELDVPSGPLLSALESKVHDHMTELSGIDAPEILAGGD